MYTLIQGTSPVCSDIVELPMLSVRSTGLTAVSLAVVIYALYRAHKANVEFACLKDKNGKNISLSETDGPEIPNAELMEVFEEQFSRNRKFFGEEGQKRVEEAFVIVVGCGGVGSHAAAMLARSGVKKLRLIDFDNVTVSSLNRHAVATHRDVGIPKVQACANHFKLINPRCLVEPINEMFDKDSAAILLGGRPDFIIDAIDNLDTKTGLLEYCQQNKLNVVASGGAGGKSDPSFIRFADLEEVIGDELITAIRKKLRKTIPSAKSESGPAYRKHPIPVCYSAEKAKAKLLPLEEFQLDEPHQYAAVQNFRVRIIPVFGPIPAAFGNALACFVVNSIAGMPIAYSPEARLTYNNVLKMKHALERSLKIKDIGIHTYDLEDIATNVFRGRCIVTGKTDRPNYVVWNPCKPPTIANIVIMTSEEANRHASLFKGKEFDTLDLKMTDFYTPKFVETTEALLSHAAALLYEKSNI